VTRMVLSLMVEDRSEAIWLPSVRGVYGDILEDN
jgi:hypothetical protein